MTAKLPRLAALYLPDEDDYGLAIYDETRGVWVLVAGRPVGDVGSGRTGDLISAHWEAVSDSPHLPPGSDDL